MAAAADAVRGWVHPADRYPGPVRAELARRREQILVRAHGRILDLDDPESIAPFLQIGATRIGGVAGDGTAADPASPVDRYDTVVATGVLAGFADLGAIVAALAALVVDDGALLFVEPVGEPGWSHVVRASLPDPRSRGAAWRTLHLDRDIPAAVRSAGLVVCDLDRGELPAQPRSLRHWVTGRALRIPGA